MAHHMTAGIAASCAFITALARSFFLFLQPRCVSWYLQIAVLAVAEWFLFTIIKRIFFHPLSKYPGPLIAAISDWYSVYWIADGGRHLELDRQHKKYGRYVRYGPNRLSINSAAAAHDLHDVKANTFKSDAYGSFKRFFGAEMSLTTVDHKAHAFRRRVNSTALTPAAVRGLEDQVMPHIDYFLQIMGSDAGAKEDGDRGWSSGRDMSNAIAFCIADIMGSVTFSKTWNAQKNSEYRHFVKDLPNGVAGIHLVGHMQSLFLFDLHKILFKELINGVGQLMSISRSFALWRLEQTDLAHRDVWSALLDARDPKTGAAFSEEELISEASLFIIGGTDGMITSVTGTIFYLLHNPRTLERLTREIREAFPFPAASVGKPASEVKCPIRFASPELQAITYLPACIDEAMRISPPVPSILPRKVGPGGIVVDGEFFPEGINLGTPHYSLHHDPEYFPDPLSYYPERWIPEEREKGRLDGTVPSTGKESINMKAGVGQAPSFSPFGLGRSSCIGKHLAYQEMSIILAQMIWLFDLRLDPENSLGEGTGTGNYGRSRKDEFQLFDRFVSAQKGPVVQFRYREEIGV